MHLKIELDEQTANRLVEAAAKELRPVHWEAEAILMRVLGTWQANEYPSSQNIIGETKRVENDCAQS